MRFVPDTWLDAIARPFAMVVPNGWVYVEIIAPDLRLAAAILLGVLALVLGRRARASRACLVLAAFSLACFASWLVTTGNGRYFIPVLLIAGILCVGFIDALPASRPFRATMALVLLALQGFLVFQNHPWSPWNPWAFLQWREAPYMHVERDEASLPQTTYVGLSVISYSLIAPQFPPDSRWINLSALEGVAPEAPDRIRARRFLREARHLRLLVPSLPSVSLADGRPSADAVVAMNALLAEHQLAIADGAACRFLESRTMEAESARTDTDGRPKVGFWACPLAWIPPGAAPVHPVPPGTDEVLAVLERACPRVFIPGLARVTPIPSGAMRHYQGSDMKVYVLNDGLVLYKYFRALNAVRLGTIQDVLAPGFTLDCNRIRGRSGLPWQREL